MAFLTGEVRSLKWLVFTEATQVFRPTDGRAGLEHPVHLSNSDPDQHRGSFPDATVIVWDQDQKRLQAIGQIIKSCGARIHEIKRIQDVSSIECRFRQSLALIGLGDRTSLEANTLSVIRALNLKGFKTISFEADVLSWPIGTRCRVLLSGCSLLLDSSAKTFPRELAQALTKALESEAASYFEEQRIKRQMNELGIIGESSQMMSVFRWVSRVSALSDFPVLINGETGTGKELIANALHCLDVKRCKGQFIAANCSAISSGLAESELFGHRRGAFTGADSDRKGLFRSAEGGVLFLDELSELSPSLQAKLLRVLQEKKVLGVGLDREVDVDVRVIAATNRNLEKMIQQGTFREDLYHRLNVLSINIPPLRERYDDLQPLIQHFLKKYSSLNQTGTETASADFVRALMGVELPGNARQLENIVRNALLNKNDDAPLGLGDLTPGVWKHLSNDTTLTVSRKGDARSTGYSGEAELESEVSDHSYFLNILDQNEWSLTKSLEYCERVLLKCALQFARGNQSQTARLIGITPRSVYNKVHKHKIDC